MAYNITFTNPDGITVNLNDHVNTFVMVGVANDLMPFFSFQEHSAPLIAGSIVSAVRVQPRSFSLPVTIMDTDRDTALARTRSILKYLNPTKGDGVLTVTNGSVTRKLYCRYKDGLASDGTGSEQFTNYVRAILTFYAADPYFYHPSAIRLTAKQVFSPVSFFPILPVQLALSTLTTSATLQNDGDVEAFPVITITGPLDDVLIENHTTGKSLQISTSILSSEVITIDARPRTRGVEDQSGANRFSLLTATSSLFPLAVGANSVEITMSGGDTNSIITVDYTPAYLSV